MVLKKYQKINRKNIVILFFLFLIFLIVSFLLFRTYAIYEEKQEYNMIEGEVPNFADVKLAVTIDGEKSDIIPERGLYATEVICKKAQGDGNYETTTVGAWDYNAWTLKLGNIENGSRCSVSFTSNLTQEEYDQYIHAGVSLRRNTYRGKDITSYFKDQSLYEMIQNCTFDDIYVGDYIRGSKFTWLIADLNNYMYTGSPILERCHATIIPDGIMTMARMNSTLSTAGGYYGSEMVQMTLTNLLHTYVIPDFGMDHVVNYYSLLSNDLNLDLVNRYGLNTGATNNFDFYERKIDLMSEVNVFGSMVWSSSGFDVGIDNNQYAIFRLRPELINSSSLNEGNTFAFWLKNVVDQYSFGYVYASRHPGGLAANYEGEGGVRPRFLID